MASCADPSCICTDGSALIIQPHASVQNGSVCIVMNIGKTDPSLTPLKVNGGRIRFLLCHIVSLKTDPSPLTYIVCQDGSVWLSSIRRTPKRCKQHFGVHLQSGMESERILIHSECIGAKLIRFGPLVRALKRISQADPKTPV